MPLSKALAFRLTKLTPTDYVPIPKDLAQKIRLSRLCDRAQLKSCYL